MVRIPAAHSTRTVWVLIYQRLITLIACLGLALGSWQQCLAYAAHHLHVWTAVYVRIQLICRGMWHSIASVRHKMWMMLCAQLDMQVIDCNLITPWRHQWLAVPACNVPMLLLVLLCAHHAVTTRPCGSPGSSRSSWACPPLPALYARHSPPHPPCSMLHMSTHFILHAVLLAPDARC